MTNPCEQSNRIEHMEQEVSEICAVIARVDERLKNQGKKLEEIHTQTSRTNGRVTKLERWKTTLMGVNIGISALLGGAITLFGVLHTIGIL